MNTVLQPRPLIVLGLNVWMGTAAGADELMIRAGGRRSLASSCTNQSLCQAQLVRRSLHARVRRGAGVA